MKTTCDRIFANDTEMMYWQEKNCCNCSKVTWFRKNPMSPYKCALQRDMECQQHGLWEINERSLNLIKGVAICPLIKPQRTRMQEISTVIDAHNFAKGKPIERLNPQEHPKPETKQAESLDLFHQEKDVADKKMIDAIVGNQTTLTEAQFKELAHNEAQRMLDIFTWKENMMIAFVPLIISKVAWVYVEKVMKYCADNRIQEFKKIGRTIKELRKEYLDVLRKDLDFMHIHRIESQTVAFMDECRNDLTILWFQVNQYLSNAIRGMPHLSMRTDAAIAMLMVHHLKAHNKRMDAIIAAKMGQSRTINNPQMMKLERLMMQYFPVGFEMGSNANIDLCGKIFANDLARIDFDLSDD